MMVVPSPQRVMLSPSNQVAHRLSRWPLRRISYRPGPPWWPADSWLMALPLLLLAWLDLRRQASVSGSDREAMSGCGEQASPHLVIDVVIQRECRGRVR